MSLPFTIPQSVQQQIYSFFRQVISVRRPSTTVAADGTLQTTYTTYTINGLVALRRKGRVLSEELYQESTQTIADVYTYPDADLQLDDEVFVDNRWSRVYRVVVFPPAGTAVYRVASVSGDERSS